jgi:ubiquinone/menaquinone biosynthesis C-methylase UbiE
MLIFSRGWNRWPTLSPGTKHFHPLIKVTILLPRVLEPESMDSMQEAIDYNNMDHTQVNRAFVDDLLAAGRFHGEILDLGTGTALIPVELVQRHPDCYVMAVDVAISMLDVARFNIEIAAATERIQLDHVDARQLPHGDDRFAAVISNGTLHHIAEPLGVLRESIRVTVPDGLLFFRDLLRPRDLETLEHLVQTYAGQENEHQQQMFARSLHAALTVDEMRALVEQLGFDPASIQVTSDRHWTWIARKPQNV